MINYIRQGNWKISSDDLERCLNDNVLSWWNENDKYCYHLNEINEPKERFEENDNFDLSTTFTMNFGENNQNIFYALEYWRFLELTGHPFRVNNVSNNHQEVIHIPASVTRTTQTHTITILRYYIAGILSTERLSKRQLLI